MLKNDKLLAKIGLGTAENGPLKVWGSSTYIPRNLNLSRHHGVSPGGEPGLAQEGRVGVRDVQHTGWRHNGAEHARESAPPARGDEDAVDLQGDGEPPAVRGLAWDIPVWSVPLPVYRYPGIGIPVYREPKL